jgi:hypothetical protein
MRIMALILIAGAALPAAAQERELCTTRPSLGTTACTVEPGHVVVEFGAIDRTLDRDAETREERLLLGDTLVRVGLGESTEVQLGWSAFGRVTERDRISGERERRTGVGDVTVALRQNFANPDGSGLSWGIQPYATLPVGRYPIGRGDWGAGLIVPVSYELSDSVTLVMDPEVDAALDEDGDGRHLSYGNVAGIELAVSKAVALTLELSTFRDRDPGDHHNETAGAVSATWQPRDDLQFDAGVIAGLNHSSADLRLVTGVSARF